MIFWNTSRFRIYVICTFEVWNMACARVHTNDRWEEKLMDGCGLGSPAVCVVILLLGHCPPPRPPLCPPPCPTPPPPLSDSIFTSQFTSLSSPLEWIGISCRLLLGHPEPNYISWKQPAWSFAGGSDGGGQFTNWFPKLAPNELRLAPVTFSSCSSLEDNWRNLWSKVQFHRFVLVLPHHPPPTII